MAKSKVDKTTSQSAAEPKLYDRINSIDREAANLEGSSQLGRDWQTLSESSLAEVWLNEEENKAWQYL
jgi:hypothetical protein